MSSPSSWGLQIDLSVFKLLKKTPKRDIERLLVAIKLLPTDPYFGDIEKMKGADNTWRRRIGNYRIFYIIKVKEKVVLVFHLERRTSKTY